MTCGSRSCCLLTDYHVHLRPDRDDNPAERYFTAANAERYRETAGERGIAVLGAAEHVYRFTAPLEVWRRYFDTVAEAARSGLYDIMAHADLVKVWGARAPRPEGDLRRYYEPAVEAFAEAGVAIELSTAGWRKPVGEQYPAVGLLEMAVDAGCAIALSSDAHVPDDLGYEYERAVELLERVGVREIAVFERRERRLEPLG